MACAIFALDQHRLTAADQSFEPGAAPACRRLAQCPGARLHRLWIDARHPRRRRALLGRIREDVAHDDVAFVDQGEAIRVHCLGLGRKSGDQVGADRDVGPLRLQPLHRPDRVGTAVAALHPLEDHVVARLEAHVEVGHEARLFGREGKQPLVHLDAVKRGEAQPRKLGHIGQDPLDQLAERRRAGQVGAVAGDVDAGEHDLLVPLGDQ
jgi:hypothetical protein